MSKAAFHSWKLPVFLVFLTSQKASKRTLEIDKRRAKEQKKSWLPRSQCTLEGHFKQTTGLWFNIFPLLTHFHSRSRRVFILMTTFLFQLLLRFKAEMITMKANYFPFMCWNLTKNSPPGLSDCWKEFDTTERSLLHITGLSGCIRELWLHLVPSLPVCSLFLHFSFFSYLFKYCHSCGCALLKGALDAKK